MRRVSLTIAALALLAACTTTRTGGGVGAGWQPQLAASAWTWRVSPGVALHPQPAGSTWVQAFPIHPQIMSCVTDQDDGCDALHYVTVDASGSLSSAKSITLEYDVYLPPGVTLNATLTKDDTCNTLPRVRLLLWHGTGYQLDTNRWWSVPGSTSGDGSLAAGHHSLTVSLTDLTKWKPAEGATAASTPAAYAAVLASPSHVGFTFGACYAGHGVAATAPGATFTLAGYSVQW